MCNQCSLIISETQVHLQVMLEKLWQKHFNEEITLMLSLAFTFLLNIWWPDGAKTLLWELTINFIAFGICYKYQLTDKIIEQMIALFNNDSVIATDVAISLIDVEQKRHNEAKTNEAYKVSTLSLLQYMHTKKYWMYITWNKCWLIFIWIQSITKLFILFYLITTTIIWKDDFNNDL